jgi:hypothetical protein
MYSKLQIEAPVHLIRFLQSPKIFAATVPKHNSGMLEIHIYQLADDF